jgi:hypothetical protein
MLTLIKLLLLILLVGLAPSCTNEKGAIQALEAHGFKKPYKIGGYDFLSCSEDDFYATRFMAYTQDSSKVVSGCVCEGIFKGKTVRID